MRRDDQDGIRQALPIAGRTAIQSHIRMDLTGDRRTAHAADVLNIGNANIITV